VDEAMMTDDGNAPSAAASAPVALITGIRGQDGWYLAQRLLGLGYRVVGTTHDAAHAGAIAIDGRDVPVIAVDLGDAAQIDDAIRRCAPDEVYNFAARASSAQLFDDPLATAEINGVAVARLLEAIQRHRPAARFCQASSSEVFAGAAVSPQDESCARLPINAYGAAKAFADHLVAAYRRNSRLFACSAILYPHESPRRPVHFLVRKVARAAAAIAAGQDHALALGDLGAVRDWGYAPDVVEAMRRMLQQSAPRDYVIATGEPHTVRDVCEAAFGRVGLDWRRHVAVDERLVRAPDDVIRVGDPGRARAELNWAPSLTFREMIGHIVDCDRRLLAPPRSAD
jgi:GDPmannose 4,6-dehydratase